MSGSSGIVGSAGRGLGALLLLAAGASAQRMKEYEFVRIVEDEAYQDRVAINNKGDIVFASTPDYVDDPRSEIFLWRNGVLHQITNDDVNDRIPDINDEGVIVWYSGIGPVEQSWPTYEIMMRYPDGEVIRLTDNDHDDEAPKINNRGEVVWSAHLDYACSGGTTERDLFLFDGVETRRLTFDAEDQNEGLSNQAAAINDLGQIAWTRYDFCTDGEWTSRIMFFDGETMFPVSPEGSRQPQATGLNNHGQVVWGSVDASNHKIEMWHNGVANDLWFDGHNPSINDHGWVVFNIFSDVTRTTDLYLWRKGKATRLTFSDHEDDRGAHINRRGDIAFTCGLPFWADVCLFKRLRLNQELRGTRVYP